MRVFKDKQFHKWAVKEGLTDEIMAYAVAEMEKGLIDADLGGNVYKKRVARPGQGKRGSTRTIVAFKINERAFFIYGFSKSDKDNINKEELAALKRYAALLFSYSEKQIELALKVKDLMEVKYG